MKKLGCVLLLLLATRAWAYRGRPVSDLRFDGWASVSFVELASDGSGFLALLSTGRAGDEHVSTQKIVAGAPVGPQRQIASGTPAGLGWTGTDYLAAWKNGQGLWVAPVSRDGSLRSTPAAPVLTDAGSGYLAVGRHSALAFGYTEYKLKVQLLDLSGRPQRNPVTYIAPARFANVSVAATADGFAVVFSGGDGTWLMRLTAAGAAFEPQLLDGPYGRTTADYHSNVAAIATDGTDTVIVYGAGRYAHEAQLKSVTVAADGKVRRSGVIYEIPGGGNYGLRPGGLVWDGTQYVAALTIDQNASPHEDKPAVALLRIHRTGERNGDPYPAGTQANGYVTALATSDRELVFTRHNFLEHPHGTFASAVDPGTMRTTTPARLARTLSSQHGFTIEAGHGGYLATWYEYAGDVTTIRASRIDRNGNYLDGEGIILDTLDRRYVPNPYYEPTVAIDGSGPQWLVVWFDGGLTHGRSISVTGRAAGTDAFTLGPGRHAAVRWAGQYYVVLRSDGSLHRDLVTGSGNVFETKVLAAQHVDEADDRFVVYAEPSLVQLRSGTLAVFTSEATRCWIGTPGGCSGETTVLGLRLDAPGAEPFVIASNVWGEVRAAAGPDHALVMWSQYQGLFYSLLPADAPEQPSAPRLVEANSRRPDVAFDGSGFVAVWWRRTWPGPNLLITGRIDEQGTVSGTTAMRLEEAEEVWNPVVAAGPAAPALTGYLGRHAAYDGVSRAMLLFATEIDGDPAPAPASAPSIVCATSHDDDTVTVRWQPVQDVLGFAVELQLSDDTFRPVGVAPAGATSVRASLAGLPHSAARVRAWNATGLSAPSSIAPSLPPPFAVLRSSLRVCAGVPVTVNVTLRGTPPFTIRWSDGMVQSNVRTSSTTRTVTATINKTLKIVQVADASCAVNEVPESLRISVDPLPAVSVTTAELRIARGETATLTVASKDVERHAWYEGAPGDTSHPVGTDSPTYTTPPLQRSTRYWVRVANRCGSADSASIAVTVPAKGRAARH